MSTRQRPLHRRGRGRGAGAEPAVGDGDRDQDDKEPGPVGSSTRRCDVRDGGEACRGVPLRCVRAVESAGRLFSTSSRPALRGASGHPPARRRHGGHRGTGLTLHLGGTNPRRTSHTTSEAGGRRRASVALPPGRLNVLLRAIPAGRALVMEPALACPTTTPPKPRPHRLDPVQHARPPLTPTVLHARPNNKRSAKT
jgi:hypothetical protein